MIKDSYNITFDVLRQNDVVDSGGALTENNIPDGAAYPGRIEAKSGMERMANAKAELKADYTLLCNAITIDEKCEVLSDGITYEVVFVNDSYKNVGNNPHLEIDILKRI